jgi:phospholipid-binding lipoprotein MlaA
VTSRWSGPGRSVLFAVLAVLVGGCASLGGMAPGAPRALPGDAPPARATLEPAPGGPDLWLIARQLDAREERPRPLWLDDRPLTLLARPDWQLPEIPDVSLAGRPGLLLASATESDAPVLLAAAERPGPPPDVFIEEYDPWEPFNEAMFEFNRWLDRWIIKPAAQGYNAVVPEDIQVMIDNGFRNIAFVPRFVNSLLQAKFGGAGRELGRFLINSTLGIGGLFDIARQEFGIRKSDEDFGQTLAVWGAGPGPYLILPLMPPYTVRDFIGSVVDGFMNPLNYFLPFFPDRFAMKAGDTLNDRSLNLDLYHGFEETTVEFYSALRNAYLQRRQKLISE